MHFKMLSAKSEPLYSGLNVRNQSEKVQMENISMG